MKLRPATMVDAELLLEWRNDPLTREKSITTDPVPYDAHVQWLERSIASASRTLLVAEDAGVPVGTVRLDDGDPPEISYTVAPDHRGKGYAEMLVRLAAPDHCEAEVKPGNKASIRALTKSGFVLSRESDELLHFSKKETAVKDEAYYLAIIDEIEAVRGRNNKNWMDLLRLSFKHAPKEAAAIVAEIYREDSNISELAAKLTK